MARYVFITGGVVSALGKDPATAGLGALLQARDHTVRLHKLDPYLNVDPGAMGPLKHGEVFVTDNDTETDLDLGISDLPGRWEPPDFNLHLTPKTVQSASWMPPATNAGRDQTDGYREKPMKHLLAQQGLWKGLHPSLRIAAKGMIAVFIFFTVLNVDLGFAQTDGHPCENYKTASQAEELRNPDLATNYDVAYGWCLLGEGDRGGGLRLLQNLLTFHNHPVAAWVVATELFDGIAEPHNDHNLIGDHHDQNSLNGAIDRYGNVLFFIDLLENHEYPGGKYEYWTGDSRIPNLEVFANREIVHAYFHKYTCGTRGRHNYDLLSSPGYTGNQDLDTCRKHRPYVISNLDQTIFFAKKCLGTRKKDHFDTETYTSVKEFCKDMKELADKILPLEREKGTILVQDYCQDVLQCSEYKNIRAEIDNILDTPKGWW